ncbi:MAG: SH3 domain-containing protein [Acetobacterales bacterium]
MIRNRAFSSALLVATALGTGLWTEAARSQQAGEPRFGSFRASEVNLRAGPGMRYPVEWTFLRRNLPVLVLRELDTWRQVRAADGTEGWVHQSMLSGRRSVMVTGDAAEVLADPEPGARAKARAEGGAIGFLRSCTAAADWCAVEFPGAEGWVARSSLWGVVTPGEPIPVTAPLPEGEPPATGEPAEPAGEGGAGPADGPEDAKG